MNKKNDKMCSSKLSRFKPQVKSSHDSSVRRTDLDNYSYLIVVGPKTVNSNRIKPRNTSTRENKNLDVYDFAEDSDDKIVGFKEIVTLNKDVVNKHISNLGTDIVRIKDKNKVRLLQNYVKSCESKPLSITRDSVNGRSRENFTQECAIKHISEKQVPDPNTIIPKKTVDITKIKGWRNKQFTFEKCLSNVNSILKKTNIKKELNKSVDQSTESGITQDNIAGKDQKKDYAFVCDKLDDFLDQEAELKINYEIPHLYAEYGIKLTSEELVSRPKFNISSVNSKLPVLNRIVPDEKSATVSFDSPKKVITEENSSALTKKPSSKIKNSIKNKSLSSSTISKENHFSRGKPMHILEKKIKTDAPLYVTQSGRRSGKIQQTSENKPNEGENRAVNENSLSVRKNNLTIVNNIKTLNNLPKPVPESFANYKFEIRKFGMVLYPGPSEPLNPFITYHLQKLRSHRTVIDRKWANFSVSAVVQKNTPIVRKRMVLPLTCCFKIKKDASENLAQNYRHKTDPITKAVGSDVTDSAPNVELPSNSEILNKEDQGNSSVCEKKITDETEEDIKDSAAIIKISAVDIKLCKAVVKNNPDPVWGNEIDDKIKIEGMKKEMNVTDSPVEVKIEITDRSGEKKINEDSSSDSGKELLQKSNIVDNLKETTYFQGSNTVIETATPEKKFDKDIEKRIHQGSSFVGGRDNLEKSKIGDKKQEPKNQNAKDSSIDIKVITADKRIDKNGEEKINEDSSSVGGRDNLDSSKFGDKEKETNVLNTEGASTNIKITVADKNKDKSGEKMVNKDNGSVSGEEIADKSKITEVIRKKRESITQSDLTKKINETKFDLYEEEVKCVYSSTDEIDMINCKTIDNFSSFSDDFSDDSNSSNSHIVFEKRNVKTSIGQCIEENMRNYPEVIDVEDDGTEFNSTNGLSETSKDNTYQKTIGNLLTKKLNALKQTGMVATSIDNLKIMRPNALELIKLNFIKENYQTGYINLWYLKSPDSGKSRVFLTFSMNPPMERAKNLKMISKHKITNPPNIVLEIVAKEKSFDANDFAILYCNGSHWEIHGSLNFVVNKLDYGNEENEKIQVFHLPEKNFTELEMLHSIKRKNDKNKVVKWWVMHMMQEYKEITIRCGDQVGRISRSIIIKTWETKVSSFIEFKGLRNIRPIGVGVNPRLWPYFLIGPYHVEDHHNLTLKVNDKIVPFDYFLPADKIRPVFLLKKFITSVIMHSWRNNRRIVAMWLYDRIAIDRGSFIQVKTRLKKPGGYDGLIEHDYSRGKLEDGPYQPKVDNKEKVTFHPPAAASSSLSLAAPPTPPPSLPPPVPPASALPHRPLPQKKSYPTQKIFLVPNVPNLGYIKGELHPDKSITIKHPLKPERKRNFHRIGDWLNRIMKKRIKFFPGNFRVKWKIVKNAKLVRNLEPLNRSTLGGTHILCKKGLFYLLSLTKEKIAKLGLSETVVLNTILNNPIVKEVSEMKELGKMLLNKEMCDVPMADVLRMALVEIEKLEEEEKRLKCRRLSVEKEREILCRKYLDVLDECNLDENSMRTITFYVTGILQSCETADGKLGDSKREKENLQRLEAISKFLFDGSTLAPANNHGKTDSSLPMKNENEKPQVENISTKNLSTGLNTVSSPVQVISQSDNEKFGELESKIKSLHESLNKMAQDDASLRERLTKKLNAMSEHLEKMKRNRNINGNLSSVINEKIDSSATEESNCQSSPQLNSPQKHDGSITLGEKDFFSDGVGKVITKRKSSDSEISMTEELIKMKTSLALTRLKKYVLEGETCESDERNKSDENEDMSGERMTVVLRELEQIGVDRSNLESENSENDKLTKVKETSSNVIMCMKRSKDLSNESDGDMSKLRKEVKFEVIEPISVEETKTEKKLKRQIVNILANGKDVFVVNKKVKMEEEEDGDFGMKLRKS